MGGFVAQDLGAKGLWGLGPGFRQQVKSENLPACEQYFVSFEGGKVHGSVNSGLTP